MKIIFLGWVVFCPDYNLYLQIDDPDAIWRENILSKWFWRSLLSFQKHKGVRFVESSVFKFLSRLASNLRSSAEFVITYQDDFLHRFMLNIGSVGNHNNESALA
nr:uncharacterized protein LOC112940735 [Solanum lycopersicum]